MKKIIWKNFWQSIAHTKGQFLSIVGLMMIGAFALVGLFVTGPDMRSTGNHYAQKLNTPDLTVISNYGLDQGDTKKIRQVKGLKDVEFGYMTDTVLKNSDDSFRIFSKPSKIGKYQITKGYLPKHKNEIALADHYSNKFRLGQIVSFSEKKNILGFTLLKRRRFKIVGFVRSSQILSNVNLGQSSSGTGELKGFGVVMPTAFNHKVYTIANLTYQDLNRLDSYGKDYTNKVSSHKKELQSILRSEASKRKSRIITSVEKELQLKRSQLDNTQQKFQLGRQELDAAQNQLKQQKATLTAQIKQNPSLEMQQVQAELIAKEKLLQKKKQILDQKAAEVEPRIKAGKRKLANTNRQLNNLNLPSYNVYNRREVPGGEGNVVYTTVAQVVEDLAKVFPIFLYFVAALVTFTTMNRFIDEERINSGTLKALGYDDYVIINKFICYGFLSGTIGTIIGVYLGHTLLPQIVYHAYYKSITIPPIEEHFHWQISLVALILSWISSVLPAYLTAKNEFREKPAALLLPKPPAVGAKIILEHFPFIWNHLSFTHKVTARNIFRYKKRMLMTIFGVCGSATLLFAGFAVKNSISNMNNRQFSGLIHYNMIVAQKTPLTLQEKQDLNSRLHGSNIKSEIPVYYESMSKVAGENADTQDITLIAPNSSKQLKNYVHLDDRQSKRPISLTNHGVVISERLASLLNVTKGDHITLTDKNNHQRTMKVADITEMYMGHFVFMDRTQYEKIFSSRYKANAHLVKLNDGSRQNTKKMAAKFMNLTGVIGVVQNTAISQELDVVVQSLNMIMLVLIVVAGLLAIVILYNLTNINIAERIRELSTIKVLGFYDKEVTMYIYRETILLTGIGILVGYLTGDLLYRYILYVVPPANVMFNPALSASSFLWPLGVIGIITIILGFIVNSKLKNLDMLDALKSVD
ncbi:MULTISPECIES: ABC transporter permease [unclassified Lactobacillus]|uniref:ABC transporter permease n=1 Tax=unclassified Lactobacillus TaxID=2620435 RepID=UPI000EFCDE30|nr:MULTISPECIES: ABC transporter permease [unclassified Lactobacillus]RMC25018.1 FtsX-like permease family protein [Lactobacillus sp. ESL0247]RMC29173.1 FtsX-like permease family protein [Lactobacillus sp. ESL0246]RMC32776.1 FtsX-like permease family protein [Lactobacillus sp. ESL0245]